MTNRKHYLIDTNTLISNLHVLDEYDVVISSHILREIEHLELTRKSDKQLQYEIRQTKNALDEKEHLYTDLDDYEFKLNQRWDKQYVDNIIIQACVEKNYGLITRDKLLRDKAKLYNIEIIKPDKLDKDYVDHKGFKIIEIDELKHVENMINDTENHYELLINEYAVINNVADGELLDIVKWTGEITKTLRDDKGRLGYTIRSEHFGEMTTLDEYQIMAVDSIKNNQVTLLRGTAGTGKSKLTLETAWELVEREGYKLVIVVQPIDAHNSVPLGFYKGTKLEKILQSVGTIVPKFGSEEIIEQYILEGKLEFQTYANLRGYDTGDSKVVVWCVESQNTNTSLMQLAGQRLGINTKWIIDGDFNTQIDSPTFVYDSGMKRISEVLRGEDLYGEVELQVVYRSRLAELLQKM